MGGLLKAIPLPPEEIVIVIQLLAVVMVFFWKDLVLWLPGVCYG